MNPRKIKKFESRLDSDLKYLLKVVPISGSAIPK